MRSMVEGAHLGAARNDAGKDGVQVAQHLSRGNSHDIEPIAPKQRIAGGVAARLVTTIV